MVFSFVFVEITGDSYADFSRRLTNNRKSPLFSASAGCPTDQPSRGRGEIDSTTPFTNTSTLPPTSSSREVHDRDISAPEVRPKSEILNDTEEAADSVEDESFSQEEIVRDNAPRA